MIQRDITAKISALSSGNVSKDGHLTDKDLLEKAATMKRFFNICLQANN